MLLESKAKALWNKLGKRHIELAKGWSPSILGYGFVVSVGIIYLSDWKVIVTKIPWYNGKFKSPY